MRRFSRKTAPKVKGGKVQRKNRTALSNHYNNCPQPRPVIDRLKPGEGYRHYLKIKDIKRFIGILPDWDELSKGLNAILLAPGEYDVMGWHSGGIVAVCAWERDRTVTWSSEFVRNHEDIFERLGIVYRRLKDDFYECEFDDRAIRGFQLMHILIHELGHHHDRMTTRSKRKASRGEDYAEEYTRVHGDELWARYFDEFG
jgi:hypothetical protein